MGNDTERDSNALLALLHGIQPRDVVEALLATKMAGAHSLAMTFMGRSILESQTTEGADSNVNRAVKLMKVFTQLVEALTKYRNLGQQHITVQHVQVNGQAIVGTVHQSQQAGGGDHEKSEDLPHAKRRNYL